MLSTTRRKQMDCSLTNCLSCLKLTKACVKRSVEVDLSMQSIPCSTSRRFIRHTQLGMTS